MTLYELHGYRTDCYDKGSDRTIRLKDLHFLAGAGRVWDWIAAFLSEFPDGKVEVRVVGRGWHKHEDKKVRKIKTVTKEDVDAP